MNSKETQRLARPAFDKLRKIFVVWDPINKCIFYTDLSLDQMAASVFTISEVYWLVLREYFPYYAHGAWRYQAGRRRIKEDRTQRRQGPESARYEPLCGKQCEIEYEDGYAYVSDGTRVFSAPLTWDPAKDDPSPVVRWIGAMPHSPFSHPNDRFFCGKVIRTDLQCPFWIDSPLSRVLYWHGKAKTWKVYNGRLPGLGPLQGVPWQREGVQLEGNTYFWRDPVTLALFRFKPTNQYHLFQMDWDSRKALYAETLWRALQCAHKYSDQLDAMQSLLRPGVIRVTPPVEDLEAFLVPLVQGLQTFDGFLLQRASGLLGRLCQWLGEHCSVESLSTLEETVGLADNVDPLLFSALVEEYRATLVPVLSAAEVLFALYQQLIAVPVMSTPIQTRNAKKGRSSEKPTPRIDDFGLMLYECANPLFEWERVEELPAWQDNAWVLKPFEAIVSASDASETEQQEAGPRAVPSDEPVTETEERGAEIEETGAAHAGPDEPPPSDEQETGTPEVSNPEGPALAPPNDGNGSAETEPLAHMWQDPGLTCAGWRLGPSPEPATPLSGAPKKRKEDRVLAVWMLEGRHQREYVEKVRTVIVKRTERKERRALSRYKRGQALAHVKKSQNKKKKSRRNRGDGDADDEVLDDNYFSVLAQDEAEPSDAMEEVEGVTRFFSVAPPRAPLSPPPLGNRVWTYHKEQDDFFHYVDYTSWQRYQLKKEIKNAGPKDWVVVKTAQQFYIDMYHQSVTWQQDAQRRREQEEMNKLGQLQRDLRFKRKVAWGFSPMNSSSDPMQNYYQASLPYGLKIFPIDEITAKLCEFKMTISKLVKVDREDHDRLIQDYQSASQLMVFQNDRGKGFTENPLFHAARTLDPDTGTPLPHSGQFLSARDKHADGRAYKTGDQTPDMDANSLSSDFGRMFHARLPKDIQAHRLYWEKMVRFLAGITLWKDLMAGHSPAKFEGAVYDLVPIDPRPDALLRCIQLALKIALDTEDFTNDPDREEQNSKLANADLDQVVTAEMKTLSEYGLLRDNFFPREAQVGDLEAFTLSLSGEEEQHIFCWVDAFILSFSYILSITMVRKKIGGEDNEFEVISPGPKNPIDARNAFSRETQFTRQNIIIAVIPPDRETQTPQTYALLTRRDPLQLYNFIQFYRSHKTIIENDELTLENIRHDEEDDEFGDFDDGDNATSNGGLFKKKKSHSGNTPAADQGTRFIRVGDSHAVRGFMGQNPTGALVVWEQPSNNHSFFSTCRDALAAHFREPAQTIERLYQFERELFLHLQNLPERQALLVAAAQGTQNRASDNAVSAGRRVAIDLAMRWMEPLRSGKDLDVKFNDLQILCNAGFPTGRHTVPQGVLYPVFYIFRDENDDLTFEKKLNATNLSSSGREDRPVFVHIPILIVKANQLVVTDGKIQTSRSVANYYHLLCAPQPFKVLTIEDGASGVPAGDDDAGVASTVDRQGANSPVSDEEDMETIVMEPRAATPSSEHSETSHEHPAPSVATDGSFSVQHAPPLQMDVARWTNMRPVVNTVNPPVDSPANGVDWSERHAHDLPVIPVTTATKRMTWSGYHRQEKYVTSNNHFPPISYFVDIRQSDGVRPYPEIQTVSGVNHLPTIPSTPFFLQGAGLPPGVQVPETTFRVANNDGLTFPLSDNVYPDYLTAPDDAAPLAASLRAAWQERQQARASDKQAQERSRPSLLDALRLFKSLRTSMRLAADTEEVQDAVNEPTHELPPHIPPETEIAPETDDPSEIHDAETGVPPAVVDTEPPVQTDEEPETESVNAPIHPLEDEVTHVPVLIVPEPRLQKASSTGAWNDLKLWIAMEYFGLFRDAMIAREKRRIQVWNARRVIRRHMLEQHAQAPLPPLVGRGEAAPPPRYGPLTDDPRDHFITVQEFEADFQWPFSLEVEDVLRRIGEKVLTDRAITQLERQIPPSREPLLLLNDEDRSQISETKVRLDPVRARLFYGSRFPELVRTLIVRALERLLRQERVTGLVSFNPQAVLDPRMQVMAPINSALRKLFRNVSFARPPHPMQHVHELCQTSFKNLPPAFPDGHKFPPKTFPSEISFNMRYIHMLGVTSFLGGFDHPRAPITLEGLRILCSVYGNAGAQQKSTDSFRFLQRMQPYLNLVVVRENRFTSFHNQLEVMYHSDPRGLHLAADLIETPDLLPQFSFSGGPSEVKHFDQLMRVREAHQRAKVAVILYERENDQDRFYLLLSRTGRLEAEARSGDNKDPTFVLNNCKEIDFSAVLTRARERLSLVPSFPQMPPSSGTWREQYSLVSRDRRWVPAHSFVVSNPNRIPAFIGKALERTAVKGATESLRNLAIQKTYRIFVFRMDDMHAGSNDQAIDIKLQDVFDFRKKVVFSEDASGEDYDLNVFSQTIYCYVPPAGKLVALKPCSRKNVYKTRLEATKTYGLFKTFMNAVREATLGYLSVVYEVQFVCTVQGIDFPAREVLLDNSNQIVTEEQVHARQHTDFHKTSLPSGLRADAWMERFKTLPQLPDLTAFDAETPDMSSLVWTADIAVCFLRCVFDFTRHLIPTVSDLLRRFVTSAGQLYQQRDTDFDYDDRLRVMLENTIRHVVPDDLIYVQNDNDAGATSTHIPQNEDTALVRAITLRKRNESIAQLYASHLGALRQSTLNILGQSVEEAQFNMIRMFVKDYFEHVFYIRFVPSSASPVDFQQRFQLQLSDAVRAYKNPRTGQHIRYNAGRRQRSRFVPTMPFFDPGHQRMCLLTRQHDYILMQEDIADYQTRLQRRGLSIDTPLAAMDESSQGLVEKIRGLERDSQDILNDQMYYYSEEHNKFTQLSDDELAELHTQINEWKQQELSVGTECQALKAKQAAITEQLARGLQPQEPAAHTAAFDDLEIQLQAIQNSYDDLSHQLLYLRKSIQESEKTLHGEVLPGHHFEVDETLNLYHWTCPENSQKYTLPIKLRQEATLSNLLLLENKWSLVSTGPTPGERDVNRYPNVWYDPENHWDVWLDYERKQWIRTYIKGPNPARDTYDLESPPVWQPLRSDNPIPLFLKVSSELEMRSLPVLLSKHIGLSPEETRFARFDLVGRLSTRDSVQYRHGSVMCHILEVVVQCANPALFRGADDDPASANDDPARANFIPRINNHTIDRRRTKTKNTVEPRDVALRTWEHLNDQTLGLGSGSFLTGDYDSSRWLDYDNGYPNGRAVDYGLSGHPYWQDPFTAFREAFILDPGTDGNFKVIFRKTPVPVPNFSQQRASMRGKLLTRAVQNHSPEHLLRTPEFFWGGLVDSVPALRPLNRTFKIRSPSKEVREYKIVSRTDVRPVYAQRTRMFVQWILDTRNWYWDSESRQFVVFFFSPTLVWVKQQAHFLIPEMCVYRVDHCFEKSPDHDASKRSYHSFLKARAENRRVWEKLEKLPEHKTPPDLIKAIYDSIQAPAVRATVSSAPIQVPQGSRGSGARRRQKKRELSDEEWKAVFPKTDDSTTDGGAGMKAACGLWLGMESIEETGEAEPDEAEGVAESNEGADDSADVPADDSADVPAADSADVPADDSADVPADNAYANAREVTDAPMAMPPDDALYEAVMRCKQKLWTRAYSDPNVRRYYELVWDRFVKKADVGHDLRRDATNVLGVVQDGAITDVIGKRQLHTRALFWKLFQTKFGVPYSAFLTDETVRANVYRWVPEFLGPHGQTDLLTDPCERACEFVELMNATPNGDFCEEFQKFHTPTDAQEPADWKFSQPLARAPTAPEELAVWYLHYADVQSLYNS